MTCSLKLPLVVAFVVLTTCTFTHAHPVKDSKLEVGTVNSRSLTSESSSENLYSREGVLSPPPESYVLITKLISKTWLVQYLPSEHIDSMDQGVQVPCSLLSSHQSALNTVPKGIGIRDIWKLLEWVLISGLLAIGGWLYGY